MVTDAMAVVTLEIDIPITWRASDFITTVRTIFLTVALPGAWYAILQVGQLGSETREVIGSTSRRNSAILAVFGEYESLGTGTSRTGASTNADVRATTVLVQRTTFICIHHYVAG